jgi:hypothetical protein
MAAGYDTDHELVVAEIRERLSVNKQRMHIFHMERFKLRKLNEIGVKSSIVFRSQIGFAALKYFYVEVDINSAWESIRENIKISAK